MKLRKIISLFLVLILFVGLWFIIKIYRDTFTPNTSFNQKEQYVFIPTNSSYTEVQEILMPYIKNFKTFESLAKQFGYDNQLVEGRFLLKKDMNNYEIFQALKKNLPVKVIFNNQETIEKLSGRLSKQIEADSLLLLNTFTAEKFLKDTGFTKETILSMFLPDTFEFYWNVNPLKVRNMLHKQYIKFWNEQRINKAKTIGLSPVEISILASIVQKESAKEDERPIVAGVYLNRLKKGMLLQADPTVVYAKKIATNFQESIKRVYLKDLKIESPYNTYLNKGLPPGPISMPDKSSLNAVLNYKPHDYIFFCANVDKPGYHAFAKTPKEHSINRDKYIAWLNQNKIQ